MVQYVPDAINGKTFRGKGKWLEKPFPVDLLSRWTSWLWITVYVPKETLPGSYGGKLTIGDGEGKTVVLPIHLTVLDFEFKYPAGSWGMFVPGHFKGPDIGLYDNYGLNEMWKAESLPLYIKYSKAHGFNSLILYSVYPELKCIDGHVVVDVPTVHAFANAMNAEGLDGMLGIDLRWIEFWSGVASQKIRQLRSQGKNLKGDLGIYGPDGSEDARLGFNDDAKKLFREAVEQLIVMAEKEKWPKYRFMVEEEL